MFARHITIVAAGAVAALALSGCAGASPPAAESGLAQVVASTDVYGDIVENIGGDDVEVTSIISGAAVDPHSYEATVQDELALSRADLVIANGGGYDPFVDSLIETSGAEDVVVLTASEASGLLEGDGHADEEHAEEEGAEGERAEEEHGEGEHAEHGHIEGSNEHVWYSIHEMHHLAEEIAHALGEIDPDNASAYDENAAAFVAELEALEARAGALQTTAGGAGVVATEPVAVYLLEEVGLQNVTPEEFAESIEEGIDVPPTVLQETLGLVSADSIALLAYNEQTTDPVTDRLRQAADDAGVPVVSLSETLPEGQGYLEWMAANIDAIERALQ